MKRNTTFFMILLVGLFVSKAVIADQTVSHVNLPDPKAYVGDATGWINACVEYNPSLANPSEVCSNIAIGYFGK